MLHRFRLYIKLGHVIQQWPDQCDVGAGCPVQSQLLGVLKIVCSNFQNRKQKNKNKTFYINGINVGMPKPDARGWPGSMMNFTSSNDASVEFHAHVPLLALLLFIFLSFFYNFNSGPATLPPR